MAVTRRRGQMFLLGMLVLIALISGTLLFGRGGALVSPETQPTKGVFDRAMAEFPRAVTYAAAGNLSADAVQRGVQPYLAAQQYLFSSHALTHRSHAVVAVPDHDDLVVVVFNSRRARIQTLRVTVNGSTQDLAAVAQGRSRQARFVDVPRQTSIRVSFTADRAFNQSLEYTHGTVSALYSLLLDGDRQRWTATRRY